jgi:hypothetical protein
LWAGEEGFSGAGTSLVHREEAEAAVSCEEDTRAFEEIARSLGGFLGSARQQAAASVWIPLGGFSSGVDGGAGILTARMLLGDLAAARFPDGMLLSSKLFGMSVFSDTGYVVEPQGRHLMKAIDVSILACCLEIEAGVLAVAGPLGDLDVESFRIVLGGLLWKGFPVGWEAVRRFREESAGFFGRRMRRIVFPVMLGEASRSVAGDRLISPLEIDEDTNFAVKRFLTGRALEIQGSSSEVSYKMLSAVELFPVQGGSVTL